MDKYSEKCKISMKGKKSKKNALQRAAASGDLDKSLFELVM